MLFRNDKPIASTADIKISQDGTTCIIKLPKTKKDQSGTYKCVATNAVGTAECTCTVTVEGNYIFSKK